jgi:hypothetical protein
MYEFVNRRVLWAALLALVAAMAVAPAAQADPWWESGRGIAQAQPATTTLKSDAVDRAMTPLRVAADVNRGALVDAHDRTPVGGERVASALSFSSRSSFDWTDAAVGSAAAFAVSLLAGAVAMAVRQRRRVALP